MEQLELRVYLERSHCGCRRRMGSMKTGAIEHDYDIDRLSLTEAEPKAMRQARHALVEWTERRRWRAVVHHPPNWTCQKTRGKHMWYLR